ncbi:MAG: hypothetical protein R2847_09615 [Bacteroidia bacterium]
MCRFFNAFGPNETNPHLIPEIQKQVLEGKRKIQLGNLTLNVILFTPLIWQLLLKHCLHR